MKRAQRYIKYQKLILKMAHRFTSETLEFEELVAEGNLEFVLAQAAYIPNGPSCFSTYLYCRLEQRFLNLRRKRQRCKEVTCEELPMGNICTTESYSWLGKALENLSNDAKDIVQIALETPADLIEMVRAETKKTLSVNMAIIKRYLATKGWMEKKVSKNFKEIKKALQEV